MLEIPSHFQNPYDLIQDYLTGKLNPEERSLYEKIIVSDLTLAYTIAKNRELLGLLEKTTTYKSQIDTRTKKRPLHSLKVGND